MSRSRNQRRISHVHKDVAEVAKAAAGELYETVMRDNLVFATWKSQHPGLNDKRLRAAFVARNWSKCIPFARATMAALLSTPIDSATKDKIMEALVLDHTLIRGRADPQVVLN